MQIKILGTRAEIKLKPPLHSKHTAVLCDQKIMLDLGEEEFLKERPAAVFITHLHPDHAFFSNKHGKSVEKFLIYVPQNPHHLKSLKVVEPKETIHAEGYKIVSIPVWHSLKVISLGYIIEKNSKRIFYSGDIADMDEKDRKQLGKLDLVITEGSFIRKGGFLRRDQESGEVSGHAGIPDLVQMFEPYTRHIIFIHLGSWFMKDVKKGKERIQRLGNKKLTVEAAFDGQIIEV